MLMITRSVGNDLTRTLRLEGKLLGAVDWRAGGSLRQAPLSPEPNLFRVYPESYAALFLTYLNGIGFRASSGASRLIIPPMALILIQASLDSVRRS